MRVISVNVVSVSVSVNVRGRKFRVVSWNVLHSHGCVSVCGCEWMKGSEAVNSSAFPYVSVCVFLFVVTCPRDAQFFARLVQD